MAERKPVVELRISTPAPVLRFVNRADFICQLFLKYFPSGWYRYKAWIYEDGHRVKGFERSFFVNPRCMAGERQGTSFGFDLEFTKPGTHRVWIEIELYGPDGKLVWKGRSNVVEVTYAPPGSRKRIEMEILRVPKEVMLGVEPKKCPHIVGRVVVEGYPPGTYRMDVVAYDETEDRELSVSAKRINRLTETKRIAEFPFIVHLYGFKRAGEHRIAIHAMILDEGGNVLWEDSRCVTINVVEEKRKEKRSEGEKEGNKEKEKRKEKTPTTSTSTSASIGRTPVGVEVSLSFAPSYGGSEGGGRRVSEILVL